MQPLPGHPAAPLLPPAAQISPWVPWAGQSCFDMGSWPGARVMGTWRNSIPHPSVPSLGWKTQSWWERHLLWAGAMWSYATPPLPPHSLALQHHPTIIPSSRVPPPRLVPKCHQTNCHLLGHQLCTEATRWQLHRSHPFS